jgi:hypothetical protein
MLVNVFFWYVNCSHGDRDESMVFILPAVDIAACVALVDGERNLAQHRRRLAPSNLAPLAMGGELFDIIEEREVTARRFGKDADGLS